MAELTRMQSIALRLGIFRDLWRLAGRGKRWWLAPMIGMLLVLGFVLVGLNAISYLSPFIYAVL